jgi:hypothetical protein
MLIFLVDVREGQVAAILHSTIPAGPLKPQAAHTAKGGTATDSEKRTSMKECHSTARI